MFELEGRAATVTVEELRFSMPDISRFFERRLSGSELDSVLASSEGWPIALRIHRNAGRAGVAGPGADNGGDLAAGWIETRLWRGISGEEQDFVLDVPRCSTRSSRTWSRKRDRQAQRGPAPGVDGTARGAAVDRGRRRRGDATASAREGLLREAALRGDAGAISRAARRDRRGAGPPRADARSLASCEGGGRCRSARPARREHGRGAAVARGGSGAAAHGRRPAYRGRAVPISAAGAVALRCAHHLRRHRGGAARLR